MLPKINRFSFKRRVPKNVHASPFFIVRYAKTSTEDLKCAVVVGKKVHKKATERNKIKRKLVLLIEESFSRKAQVTLVVYARKPIVDVASAILKSEIVKLSDKLKVQ